MSFYQTYHLTGDILSLAVQPRKSDMLREKLSNPRLHWLRLIATGSNHLVLPAMHIRLEEAGFLTLLPEMIADHLQQIYKLNLERNLAIIRQSEEIAQILHLAGIPVMFLKGAGNYFGGFYSSPAERMMQDIDILVMENHWGEAVEVFKNAGYRSRSPLDENIQPPRKHYPRLFRDDSTASIELHRFPVGIKFNTGFSTDEVWEQRTKSALLPTASVMNVRHSIIHNFIHSQLEHQGHFFARIFLRNLYDQLLFSREADPFAVLHEWGCHPRKAAAYLEVMRKTFYPDDQAKRMPIRKTGLYPLRHELFLHSTFLSTGMQIAAKVFRSYLMKPIRAIRDRELRRRLVNNLLDRSWYKRQIRSYRRY